MNLYKKLLLAQVPIGIALAIVGFVSIVVISSLGSHSQTILKDNYRSVLAVQRMKEAIERLDSAALFIVAGERQKGIEQAEKYRPIFEAELKVQEGNITEAGEKEFTEGLRHAWTDYQAKFDRLLKSATREEARARRRIGSGKAISTRAPMFAVTTSWRSWPETSTRWQGAWPSTGKAPWVICFRRT